MNKTELNEAKYKNLMEYESQKLLYSTLRIILLVFIWYSLSNVLFDISIYMPNKEKVLMTIFVWATSIMIIIIGLYIEYYIIILKNCGSIVKKNFDVYLIEINNKIININGHFVTYEVEQLSELNEAIKINISIAVTRRLFMSLDKNDRLFVIKFPNCKGYITYKYSDL